MKDILNQLIRTNGNCVNLGRHIEASSPSLYHEILEITRFLDVKSKVKFNERVYCILHDIDYLLLDAFDKPARFVNLFLGYSLKKFLKDKMSRKKPRVKKDRKPNLGSKLDTFMSRNKRRNRHLYQDTAIEGVDYIMCPESGARLSMIKDTYITQILEMNPVDYWAKWPSLQKTCEKRKQRIQQGLQVVDPATGLTKHALSVQKSNVSKRIVNPDTGFTPLQQIGINTKKSHLENLDEYGRNGYQQLAHYRSTTVIENGLTIEQNAHIKHRETMIKRGYRVRNKYGASKISKLALRPVIDYFEQCGFKYYFDKNEYAIFESETKKMYLFDLVCPQLNIAVEFQGDCSHPCPTMSDDEWRNWRSVFNKKPADQIHQYDIRKARTIYVQKKFLVWHVWERTYKQNVEDLLCFLKTQNMKF